MSKIVSLSEIIPKRFNFHHANILNEIKMQLTVSKGINSTNRIPVNVKKDFYDGPENQIILCTKLYYSSEKQAEVSYINIGCFSIFVTI